MSDWIIIPKQHLKKIDKMLPKTAGLLQRLEAKYDPYRGKEKKFLIFPSRFRKNMKICISGVSLEWELSFLLQHHIIKIYPEMPQAEKDHLKAIFYGELITQLDEIMHANVRNVVEYARHKPSAFNCLDAEEGIPIVSLFIDARIRAAGMGLNPIQIFLEGKLDRLMSGDPRLDDYNRLSDDKKKQLRRNFIENNGWEALYSADTESS